MAVGPVPGVAPDATGATWRWSFPGGTTLRATGRLEGDLRASSAGSAERRRAVVDLPWTVPRQVHGATVAVVDAPGDVPGVEADALVTTGPGVALAVLVGDCAPVALVSAEGVIGVVHAGWRGLRAGVVEAAVVELRRLGARRVEAVVGPCIHPCCYSFGAEDLATMVDRYGASVRGEDGEGRPALDVPAAVAEALARSGADLVGGADSCTACGGANWSWRARADRQRQAMVVWR